MKRSYIIASIIVLVLGVGSFLVLSRNKSDSTGIQGARTSERLASGETGFVVERDTSLQQKQVSSEESSSGMLWRLSQPADSKQTFEITATYDDDPSIKKLTAVSGKSTREAVMDNVNIQLPKMFPEYKEISQRNTIVSGIEASETIFEYVNQGIAVKQRLLLLFKNSDTVVYIRGQAKASDYDSLNAKYFDPLFNSAKFQ